MCVRDEGVPGFGVCWSSSQSCYGKRWQLQSFRPEIVEHGSCIFNQNMLCGAPECAICWLHVHSDPVSAASCRSAAASGQVRGTGEGCARPSTCPKPCRQEMESSMTKCAKPLVLLSYLADLVPARPIRPLHLDDLVLLVAKCLSGFTHFVIVCVS